MKLVLYSGGGEVENALLNLKAIELTHKVSPRCTFIPSSAYDGELDYKYFVDEFSKLGIEHFMLFNADIPFTQTLLEEAFKSDLIFLGGGNTYYFLLALRKSNLLGLLKSFVERGGVLCGLSAGAIMMTPTITTAGMPDFDCDDNPWGVKNLKSLGIVPFDFFPHYKNSKRYDDEFLKFSKKREQPLIACSDGGGVVIDQESVSFYGKCAIFYQGKKLPLTNF